MNTRVFENPFSRSVLLHAVLFALLFWCALHSPAIKLDSDSEPVSFEVIEPAAPVAAHEKDQRTKTIVRPSQGEITDKAKDESYLSDKNRVVREERSASHPGDSTTTAAPNEIAMVTKPAVSAKPAAKAQAKTKPVKLSDLGLKIAPSKKATTFQEERKWADSQTGEAIQGGEYIQGMKEGEASSLNTKEFVFYSYFERVRKQLDQSWQPLLREQIQRIYKHGRHLASNTDFTTKTLITLTAKGEVARVQLLEESGTTDLDQAALDALNKAGPYPNPPKGLVEGTSGEVQIRWDFILKT